MELAEGGWRERGTHWLGVAREVHKKMWKKLWKGMWKGMWGRGRPCHMPVWMDEGEEELLPHACAYRQGRGRPCHAL